MHRRQMADQLFAMIRTYFSARIKPACNQEIMLPPHQGGTDGRFGLDLLWREGTNVYTEEVITRISISVLPLF